MTPLAQKLMNRIAAVGPLTLADYMEACLLDPEHGYYATRDPFGQAGDFITAPEISQMFGELIGLALAQSWIDQGSPKLFTLAEAGPGRGTLMADVLRVTKSVPGFHEAMRLVLIETSPALRRVQGETLSDAMPAWTDNFDDLPDRPLWFIANEFFDALPIRQFQRVGNAWSETVVTATDDGLALARARPVLMPTFDFRLADTKDGDILEICPAVGPIAATVGSRIARRGGGALIFDYGDWRSQGDTFQALRRHQFVDPMAEPGLADLTAHVDFEAIAAAASPAVSAPLATQGVFLERLGITARAQALAARMRGDALTTHVAAHRRLTHPEEMGTLFKILALTPPDAPSLPGTAEPGPAAK